MNLKLKYLGYFFLIQSINANAGLKLWNCSSEIYSFDVYVKTKESLTITGTSNNGNGSWSVNLQKTAYHGYSGKIPAKHSNILGTGFAGLNLPMETSESVSRGQVVRTNFVTGLQGDIYGPITTNMKESRVECKAINSIL